MFKTLGANNLIKIYSVVLALLLFGLYAASGFTHFGKMAYFILTFFGTYLILHIFKTFYLKRDMYFPLNRFIINEDKVVFYAKILLLFSFSLILIHFYILGEVPAIKAIYQLTTKEVIDTRHAIMTNTPKGFAYLSAFNLRAFIPFLLLFLYIKKKYTLLALFLFITSFYAFSLMQKSYIISNLAPVIIYAIYKRDFIFILINSVLVTAIVLSLTRIANPEINKEDNFISDSNSSLTASNFGSPNQSLEGGESGISHNSEQEPSARSPFQKIIKGVFGRIAFIPGETVSSWFEFIPSQKPFLEGDGYRVAALLRGREFRDYSSELFYYVKPEYRERAIKGSVNAASFMYDYANFGRLGLVFAGFILSFLFFIIEFIFKEDGAIKTALNIYPVLILSSAALGTTLLSGGWLLLIALYIVFLKEKKIYING